MFKKMIVSALVLVTLCAIISTEASVKGVIEDTAITTAVKANFLKETSVSTKDLQISTKDGMVKLDGNVRSHTEADKIIEVAASTQGVKEVDVSTLTVADSEHPLADAVITSKVKGVFLKESVFGNKPITPGAVHVETKDGVVFLSGNVKNEAQKDSVIQLTKSVCGVKEVNSSLSLKNK
jgi:hyperosmotically inducible protein